MISLLFPLIALLLVFALAFALIDKWNQLKRQIILRLTLVIFLLGSAGFVARYYLITGVACLPTCIGINLVGRNLSGMTLNNANFVGSNLSGSDLSNAQLQGADLSGSLLERTKLEGADLRNVKFLGANLSNANLAGTNLAGANLNGAILINADLTGVDLTQTSLLGSTLSGAEMESVDLTGVALIAVNLAGAKLNGANLVNTDLSGASLSGADLSGALLSGSNLSGAWLNLATLIGASLTKADLSGASMIGANLASADFTGSRLLGATLIGADMNGTNLNGVNMLGARLLVDELTDADLQLDRAVEELNELQRSQILVDAVLEGATFNAQTVWPNSNLDEEMAATIELIESSSDLATITDTIKVGVVHSLSGPMAISEVAMRDATFLAIDEINAAGGLLGKQLEVVIEDGASTPEVFAEKARQLLEIDEVAVIFGGWRSDSRRAMLPAIEELNGLLFYSAPYEGFERSTNVFYMGQGPSQQLIPAINYLAGQELDDILLLGSEFAYSITPHTIVKALVSDPGYSINIVGELFIPLGSTEFGPLMEQLRASAPDAIINTMYGESNVDFFQQLAEAGFTPTDFQVLSTNIAEEEVRIIGPEFVSGHLTTWDYFQTLQSAENFAFVTAYKSMYGQERVTSAPIADAYSGVYVWKTLVEMAESTDVDAVLSVINEPIEYVAPDGPVEIDPETLHTYKSARIGIVREDGLIDEVVSSEEPLPPDPFLRAYPWAQQIQDILVEPTEEQEQ